MVDERLLSLSTLQVSNNGLLTSLYFLTILAILEDLAVRVCLVVPAFLRIVHQNLLWFGRR